MKHKSVAIDGPSGAGKSTMAKRLAAALGYVYVDTGAIYRAVGLFVLRRGASPGDPEAVEPLLSQIRVRMDYGEDGSQRVYLGGEDVTGDLRTQAVSDAASQVSALPAVREYLLEMQRDMARRHDVVMDGRDIGTVVLPDADVKIFLTASARERARRRHAELLERGQAAEYETVLGEIIERDARDAGRAAAPLRQAEDAVLVDTSDKSLEESFQALLRVIQERTA